MQLPREEAVAYADAASTIGPLIMAGACATRNKSADGEFCQAITVAKCLCSQRAFSRASEVRFERSIGTLSEWSGRRLRVKTAVSLHHWSVR